MLKQDVINSGRRLIPASRDLFIGLLRHEPIRVILACGDHKYCLADTRTNCEVGLYLVADEELPDALPASDGAAGEASTADQEPTLGERVAALHLDEDQVNYSSILPSTMGAPFESPPPDCSPVVSPMRMCMPCQHHAFQGLAGFLQGTALEKLLVQSTRTGS